MFAILKQNYKFSKGKISYLAIKDWLTVYKALKDAHCRINNKKAAVKIQKTAKMYMIRKRYLALTSLRKWASSKLTSHYRKQIAYLRFRRAWFGIKTRATTYI